MSAGGVPRVSGAVRASVNRVRAARAAAESRYIDDLTSLVDAFRYENCEDCGRGADRHAFSPDPIGNPHAWCMDAPDEDEDAGPDPDELRDRRMDDEEEGR